MAINNGLPPSPDDLLRRLERIERKQRELEARTLNNATIPNLPGAGIRSSDFDGTGFANPGTQGVYVGGDGIVANRIFFQPNSIPNDWLTSPVVPGFLLNTITNFGLTTTLTNIQTVNVTVPDGCTRLAAQVTGRVIALNNTTALDYFYAQTNIAGLNGNSMPKAVSGNNGSDINVSPFAVLLTNLTPGSTVAVQMAANTSYANWAPYANNMSELSGLLLWFR